MASRSKEEKVLMLILENSPLRHWHFGEVVREAGVSRAVANKWLNRYMKEGLLKRVKEKGKFPYLTCGADNPAYQSRKRIFALQQMHQSGLIRHLISLKNARTVIVFGSMARGDWYRDSDLDIFIFGNSEGIEKHKYEQRLKRGIEVHTFGTREEVKGIRSGLIKNVINGYLIKGQIQDFAEVKLI